MSGASTPRRIFSLSEAHALLPTIRALTADAAQDAVRLTAELDAVGPDVGGLRPDARRQRIGDELNQVVARWTERIGELGLEAKGLWLVDFDNGSGYYCWRYPEDAVAHFHDYDGGFAGRMRIV